MRCRMNGDIAAKIYTMDQNHIKHFGIKTKHSLTIAAKMSVERIDAR